MTLKCIAPIKYTDREGNEKTTWRTLGRAFKNDKGLTLRLDTLPVGAGWDGSIMVRQDDDNQQRKERSNDFEDSVPF